MRIARENPGSSAKELMALLMRAASQHGGEQLQDDASLMVLKATQARSLILDGGA